LDDVRNAHAALHESGGRIAGRAQLTVSSFSLASGDEASVFAARTLRTGPQSNVAENILLMGV
jgi:hypothetical protein